MTPQLSVSSSFACPCKTLPLPLTMAASSVFLHPSAAHSQDSLSLLSFRGWRSPEEWWVSTMRILGLPPVFDRSTHPRDVRHFLCPWDLERAHVPRDILVPNH